MKSNNCLLFFKQTNTSELSRWFDNDASKPAAEQQRGLVTHLQMEHDSTFLKHLFSSVDVSQLLENWRKALTNGNLLQLQYVRDKGVTFLLKKNTSYYLGH